MLSVLLLVVGLLAGVAMFVVAILLVIVYDTCSVNACSYEGFNVGWFIAMLAPLLAYAVGTIVTIVRLRRRRRAFWVPIVALVAAALLFFVGAQLVFMSVPGASF
jgi:hypothetical protein